MKHFLNIFVALALVAGIATGCQDVVLEEAANEHLTMPTNLRYSAEGRTVTITWNLADTTNIDSIQITKDGKEPIVIAGAQTEYVVRHCVPNKDVIYTVKAMFNNGLVSKGASIRIHLNYNAPIYIGYLLTANSVAELPDDDEVAAASWFDRNYVQKGTGRFILVQDMPVLNLDEVSALWIHIDRQGLSQGWRNLTGGVNTDEFAAALRTYVEEGGKLFLSCHATQLLVAIGRIGEDRTPNTFGSGQGGPGNDIWTLNAYIGETYDRRAHALFQGMDLDYCNGYAYQSFPIAAPGIREDHNCMWNLSEMKFLSGSDKIRGFELENECTVLGTWGQNTELNYPGFCLFNTKDNFHGEIVAMGLGCYEWNLQNGNAYQYQIERLTANILNYIK